MTPKEVYELLSKTVRDADQKLRDLDCPFEVEVDLGNDRSIGWMRGKVDSQNSWRVHLAEGEGEFIPLESRRIMDRLEALKAIPLLEYAMKEKLKENIQKVLEEVAEFKATFLDS